MRRVIHVINVCDASIRKRYPWNVYLGEEQNLEDSLQPTHGPSIVNFAILTTHVNVTPLYPKSCNM
jgi:hypothetical protein